MIGEEAVKTSEIQREILSRDSVQSSLRHQFGLDLERSTIAPAELGTTAMVADPYAHFADPFTDHAVFARHEFLLGGNTLIKTIGGYRTYGAPTQIVSVPIEKRTVHFETRP